MFPTMEKKIPSRPRLRKKLKRELLDMEEFPPPTVPNVQDVLSQEEIENMDKYYFYKNKQMADLFYAG